MGQYARGSEIFYSALSILRNTRKITGMTNDAVTHNGKVLNFDATLARIECIKSGKIWIIMERLREN